MRVCVVYDCLFPHTVGGAERWYRNLAERLAAAGHEVTYLTLCQWDEGEEPDLEGVEVVAVAPRMALYGADGNRRIAPPLAFGAGVLWHLLRRGRRYDAVHCPSFPYFSLLGAWLALRLRRSRAPLVVDWYEVWGRQYWISYLGPLGGRIGYAVQRLCMRLPDRSFTFSRLHAERLRAEGHRAPITRLTGLRAAEEERTPALEAPDPPLVVFAGRHIPEKRVPSIPRAIELARRQRPELRCLILGSGPDSERTAELGRELHLGAALKMPGRVPSEQVTAALADASCLLLPSEREGYGLVVVEAVELATPAVVVAGAENAAVELVEAGQNGFVCESVEPQALADAILRVVDGGEALRRSTRQWYERHADELSIESSLEAVEAASGEAPGRAHNVRPT